MPTFKPHTGREFQEAAKRIRDDLRMLADERKEAVRYDDERAATWWNEVAQSAMDGSGSFASIESMARCNAARQHESSCLSS